MMNDEWKAHWRVVAGTGLGIATGYGVFPYVASQFVLPLQSEFGWSRGAQSLTQIATLCGAGLAPWIGRATDRFGVRRVGLVCLPALAVAYLMLSVMDGSISTFYLLMSLVIFIGIGTTGLVFTRAVITCFQASLGLALAVTRTGVAVSAALLPTLTFAIVRAAGWRSGYAALAAIVLLGMLATNRWVYESGRSAASTPKSMWRALITNRKLLLMCGAIAFTVGPVVGLLSQLQPLLTGRGIAPATASVLGGLLALSVLAGTLVTGLLVDRLWAPLIGCVFTVIPAIGCVLLVPHTLTTPAAAVAIILVGLAQGAELDLMGYLIARYFGVAQFSAIFGLAGLAVGVSCAGSSMAFAFLYDRFGDYDRPLEGCLLVFAIAGVCYLTMGPYPKRPEYL